MAALQAAKAPRPFGFINAQKLDEDPELIRVLEIWREAGFPLGNHTYSHMNLHANTAEAYAADIEKNEPVLEELMPDEDWRWLRYPYLREGDTLEKIQAVKAYLSERGYRRAGSSLDFEDYLWNAPYSRCLAAGDDEAIAWLRESYLENAAEYTRLGQETARLAYGREIKHVMVLHTGAFNALLLPDLIELLRSKGFELIELEEAMADPAYAEAPEVPSKYGMVLGEAALEDKGLPFPDVRPKPYEKLRSICAEEQAAYRDRSPAVLTATTR